MNFAAFPTLTRILLCNFWTQFFHRNISTLLMQLFWHWNVAFWHFCLKPFWPREFTIRDSYGDQTFPWQFSAFDSQEFFALDFNTFFGIRTWNIFWNSKFATFFRIQHSDFLKSKFWTPCFHRNISLCWCTFNTDTWHFGTSVFRNSKIWDFFRIRNSNILRHSNL